MRFSFAVTVAVSTLISPIFAEHVKLKPSRLALYAAPGIYDEDFTLMPIKARNGTFYLDIWRRDSHTVIQGEDSGGGHLSVVDMASRPAGRSLCTAQHCEVRYKPRSYIPEAALPIFIGKHSELRYAESPSDQLPEAAVRLPGDFKYVKPQRTSRFGLLQYTGLGGFYICYMNETLKPLDGLPRRWVLTNQLFVNDGINEFWLDRDCRSVTIRGRNMDDGAIDEIHFVLFRLKYPKFSSGTPDVSIEEGEDKNGEDGDVELDNEDEDDAELGLSHLTQWDKDLKDGNEDERDFYNLVGDEL